jgi:hypothetical protein
MLNVQVNSWVIDWEKDAKKGTVDNLTTGKRFYFTKNYGLPSIVPTYVRNIAKEMINK